MHTIMLLVCAVSISDVRADDTRLLVEFFGRVNAAKWPDAMPNHPERIERDGDGNVIRLRLDGMQLKAADFDALRQFPQLVGVTFNHTNITDADIKKLAGLRKLKGLQLSYTDIGDEGVKNLTALTSLSSVCLGSIPASPESIKALKTARPKLAVGYYRASK